jgi:integrase
MYNTLKNNDRSYYIFYKLNGKTIKVHIGKRSEGVTEAFCHQKRNEAINLAKFGEDESIIKTKKKPILFDEIAQRFLEYNKIHAKDHTNHLSRYNNHIKSYLGNKSIFDISYDDILQIQQDKLEKLAPKTVNHILQLIGTIFNYNIRNKYIKNIENPVADVKKLKVSNERLRYLSNEEVQKLYEVVEEDEQLLLFVKLALQTGGRMSTLINIKKQDIDMENRIISLQDFKNNSFYRGFFNNDVLELLEERLQGLKANEQILLYNTQASNLQTYITKKMQPILNVLYNTNVDSKDRQNRVVIHTLRHTFASHLAINGTPIYTIQKLMNHRDINMTLRYAKLAPDSGKDFVSGLYQ